MYKVSCQIELWDHPLMRKEIENVKSEEKELQLFIWYTSVVVKSFYIIFFYTI